MHKTISVTGLALVGLLSGCATTTIEEMPLQSNTPEMPPAVIGLAVYQPSSDVANLTESVRHVLNPADIYGSYANNTADNKAFRQVRYELPAAQPKKVSKPIVVAQLDRNYDPVYEAWRKYCNEGQALTKEEWELIDRTTMPAELEVIWADECVPIK
ncbi:MAG: hypothetical protein ACR2PS_13835 [Pseudomonadales bacterium]